MLALAVGNLDTPCLRGVFSKLTMPVHAQAFRFSGEVLAGDEPDGAARANMEHSHGPPGAAASAASAVCPYVSMIRRKLSSLATTAISIRRF